MNMDEELGVALRREAAPPDFAAKVMAGTRAELRAVPVSAVRSTWVWKPFTLAVAAGLTAMAIIPAIVYENQRRDEARGMKAKQDLLTALAITRDQLEQTKEKIRRTTRTIQ